METSKFERGMNETTAITSFPGFLGSLFFFSSPGTLVPAIPKRRLSEFSPPILTFQIAFVLSLFWETWEFESEILFIVLGSVASKGVV